MVGFRANDNESDDVWIKIGDTELMPESADLDRTLKVGQLPCKHCLTQLH